MVRAILILLLLAFFGLVDGEWIVRLTEYMSGDKFCNRMATNLNQIPADGECHPVWLSTIDSMSWSEGGSYWWAVAECTTFGEFNQVAQGYGKISYYDVVDCGGEIMVEPKFKDQCLIDIKFSTGTAAMSEAQPRKGVAGHCEFETNLGSVERAQGNIVNSCYLMQCEWAAAAYTKPSIAVMMMAAIAVAIGQWHICA
jgi:hypothetical protein